MKYAELKNLLKTCQASTADTIEVKREDLIPLLNEVMKQRRHFAAVNQVSRRKLYTGQVEPGAGGNKS